MYDFEQQLQTAFFFAGALSTFVVLGAVIYSTLVFPPVIEENANAV